MTISKERQSPRPTLCVDRTTEMESLSTFLRETTNNRRIKVWFSAPAAGLSTVLRHSARVLRNEGVVIYVDCCNNVANNVFSQIILGLHETYPEIWRDFELWTATRLGDSRTRDLTQSALEGLAYVGSRLRHALEPESSVFKFSSYPSAPAALICEFLLRLTKNGPVLILLDNAQVMDDWSVDLLRTTIGRAYSGLKYVIGFVSREKTTFADAATLVTRTLDVSYSVVKENFVPPDPLFVRELYKAHGVQIADNQAAALAAAADGNVYRLIASVRELSQRPIAGLLKVNAPLLQEIVGWLEAAGQALRESDLLTLCLTDKTMIALDSQEISEALQSLFNEGLLSSQTLPDGDQLIQLAHSISEDPRLVPTTDAKLLVRSNRLYEYFSRLDRHSERHSSSEVIPMLYRLSRRVDKDRTSWLIQKIIAISMKMGSVEAAERFVTNVTLPSRDGIFTFEDYITRASFFLSARLYERALDLLESPPSFAWRRDRMHQILRAIALNRCRRHQESDEAIDKLLPSSVLPEEVALLASYKISGLLHQNNISDARGVFERHKPVAYSASNYGYFLRNAADAYAPKEAISILTEAADIFDSREDRFGFASTLNNLGAKLMELFKLEEAFNRLSEAYDIIETYGTHHLHIIANNIGICNFLSGAYEEANKFLSMALRLARTPMPRIFAEINFCALMTLEGSHREAIQKIQDLEGEVANFPVDRVRQKFYINAAIVGLYGSADEYWIRAMCDKAKAYPDRLNQKTTIIRARLIEHALSSKQPQKGVDRFGRLFMPCYLMYWYQNPLEGLPQKILTFKAVR